MRLEGQRVGRYYLTQLLGSGGMGEVYLAEDPRIEQHVAIKVVHNEATPYPDVAASRESMNLFLREVKAIAKLDHPNILPLYDYGEEHIGEVKITYIVMPFRKEGSLSNWLRLRTGGELLSVREMIVFLNQAASALQHAHEHQIIHQDIKPSNFLLRERKDNPNYPELLLADFGIAKFYSASTNSSMTIRGTPTYMAPEQWRGHPVFATDQYALAIMVYQLLCGRPPFRGSLEQIMYMHFQDMPTLPSTINPRISPLIDAVLLKALAKQAEDRYPTVSEFASAYQRAALEVDARSAPVTPLPGFVTSPNPNTIAPPPPGFFPSQLPSSGTPPNPLIPPPANFSTPPKPLVPPPGFTVPSSSNVHNKDLHVTLSITAQEASTGTTRTLTLPGGRRVNVSVPAGSFNGQIIRLEGLGEQPVAGEMPGALIITLATGATGGTPVSTEVKNEVAQIQMVSPLQALRDADQTILARLTRDAAAPTTPDGLNRVAMTPPASDFAHLDQSRMRSPQQSKRGMPKLVIAILAILALLIIGGSLGTYLYINITNQQIATSHTNATATARSAVATATASWFPYPPNNGTLVLNDPLVDNSKGYNWTRGYTVDDLGTECLFTNGAYHVIESNQGRFYYCIAQKTNFANFTFQVQMTFIQGSIGDYGGIMLRSAGHRHYFFRLGRDGSYLFKVYIDDTTGTGTVLKQGSLTAIHTNLNVPNIVAVVARGGQFELYVNQTLIATINDTTYSQGQIGLVAEDEVSLTEVAFSNAKVWLL